MAPVRFNNAVQRNNSILRIIGGPADHEVPTLGWLEKERNLEGENSFAKMRGGMQIAVARQVFNRQTVRRGGAVPNGAEVMGRKNLPAVLIRDDQWQTTIWEF